MPGPRGKNIAIWRWIPAGDACAECEALRGDHPEEPSRPHPNCKCISVLMEKQIDPRNRPPYQVGFQISQPAEPGKTSSNTWTVVVTCMSLADDDDEEEGGGEDGGEWTPGKSHSGNIDLPAMPPDLDTHETLEWLDRENTALHDYARALFEGHCVGWV